MRRLANLFLTVGAVVAVLELMQRMRTIRCRIASGNSGRTNDHHHIW